jgi:hypothetical protein
MKKYLSLTIAIMMFVAVAAIAAEAQVSGTQRLRARIPFAFNVGAKSLPAGEYTITVLNPASDRKVLQIRSSDGRVSAIIQTNELNVNAPEQPKLVFNRYGDHYFFAQAQMAGDSITLAALKSNAERNAEHAIASTGRKAKVAIVART